MDTLPHLSKPSLRASHVPFFFALMAGAGRRARAAQRDGAGGTGACRCQAADRAAALERLAFCRLLGGGEVGLGLDMLLDREAGSGSGSGTTAPLCSKAEEQHHEGRQSSQLRG